MIEPAPTISGVRAEMVARIKDHIGDADEEAQALADRVINHMENLWELAISPKIVDSPEEKAGAERCGEIVATAIHCIFRVLMDALEVGVQFGEDQG